MTNVPRKYACRGEPGFSLPELLVVIGIVAVVVAITLPVIRQVRRHSQRTLCASNLHQLGIAFACYAAENRGYMPRYAEDYVDPSGPLWVIAVTPYIAVPRNWSWQDLSRASVLQCPSHPTEGIPTAFVLNCFAFETAPGWGGAFPVQVGRIKRAGALPWLLEAPDLFNTRFYNAFYDDIYFEPMHIIASPAHLRRGAAARVSVDRHNGATSNVLFLDGHVTATHERDLSLESFDDGLRSH
ncbi:MAG: prepilin-type N-terminal cleavage/methylation domain-containing protein [Tepidisphaeraceae bacterium]